MAPKKIHGKDTLKEEYPSKREEYDDADYEEGDTGMGDMDEYKVKPLQPMLTGAEFMAAEIIVKLSNKPMDRQG
jgi:hypothetical protein